MKTVPTSKAGKKAVDSTPDKLWLLSRTETLMIFPSFDNRMTAVIGNTYSNFWWLRSSSSSKANNVCYVDNYGSLPNSGYVEQFLSGGYKTRPAFLF